MRLKQDIDVQYAIKGSAHFKRRTAIFSPRKGGGHSNLTQVQNDPQKIMDILSPRAHPQIREPPKANEINGGTHHIGKPRNKIKNSDVLRPHSAPSILDTQRKAENHIRVRNMVKPYAPNSRNWDSSTYCLDRDQLQIEQDKKILSFRKSRHIVASKPPYNTSKIGASHEGDRKTLSCSFSRCRVSKTSGNIINIHSHRCGYGAAIEKHVDELNDTGIHECKWNITTRERDEEERAKPLASSDKSADFLRDEFYSHDRRLKRYPGVIVKTKAHVSTDEEWDATQNSIPRRSRRFK